MKLSAQSLKDRAKNISSDTGNKITVQEIIQNYMFERLLERLSISKYGNNLILKGGLLLSSIVGIDFRRTIDIDTCLKGIELTEENLITIITEIINIEIDDDIEFKLINTTPIRQQDEYGGYRFNLVAELENLKVNLSIDIATGDVITPKEIEYFYPLMFEDRKISIFSYNIETIIAEKLQTVVALKGLNSRSKDFYDLFFLFKNNKDYFSENIAKNAIFATFKRREMNVADILAVLESLYTNRFMKDRWSEYKKKYNFVEKVEFKEVLDIIVNGVKGLKLEV